MIVDIQRFKETKIESLGYHDGFRAGVGKPDTGNPIACYVPKALDEEYLRSSRTNVGEEAPRSLGQDGTREHRLNTAVAERVYLRVG